MSDILNVVLKYRGEIIEPKDSCLYPHCSYKIGLFPDIKELEENIGYFGYNLQYSLRYHRLEDKIKEITHIEKILVWCNDNRLRFIPFHQVNPDRFASANAEDAIKQIDNSGGFENMISNIFPNINCSGKVYWKSHIPLMPESNKCKLPVFVVDDAEFVGTIGRYIVLKYDNPYVQEIMKIRVILETLQFINNSGCVDDYSFVLTI